MPDDEQLLKRVARRYMDAGAQKGMGVVDLMEAGRPGLEEAKKRYHPERGFREETYKVWWIRSSITRALGVDPSADR